MKFAGSYKLKKFLLEPQGTPGPSIDISALIPSFSITESIELSSIRGTAMVVDSVGLLEDYPLRGEEKCTIEITDALDFTRVYHAFLYKVDQIKPNELGNMLTYTIYFTSYQSWKASLGTVIGAYSDSASYIAGQIFSEFYALGQLSEPIDQINKDQINKTIISERMDDSLIDVTIPNFAPVRAMKFLTDRAYSDISKSYSFRFFETADVFIFGSDEFLFQRGIGFEYPFTYSMVQRTPDNFLAHMNNLESISVSTHINTYNDLQEGTYASRAYVLDLNYGYFEEFDYEFKLEKENLFPKGSTGTFKDRHSDDFHDGVFTPKNGRKYYIVKQYDSDSAGSVMGNQMYPEIATKRISYRNHMRALTVSAAGPGRLDITCGDLIKLSVASANSIEPTKESTKLSGTYLIVSVEKVFDRDVMKNKYVLMKKGWEE